MFGVDFRANECGDVFECREVMIAAISARAVGAVGGDERCVWPASNSGV